jgi:hypothetical protein
MFMRILLPLKFSRLFDRDDTTIPVAFSSDLTPILLVVHFPSLAPLRQGYLQRVERGSLLPSIN